MTKLTITEMKKLNNEVGETWFGRKEMEFFNTKIETKPNKENMFITSEYMDDPQLKKYSIRQFNLISKKIETISEFQEYDTLENAKQGMRDKL